jgi:hypothetical protein
LPLDEIRAMARPGSALHERFDQYAFGPVGWKTTISELTASDLTDAHDDLRFMFELFYWALRRTTRDVIQNGAQHDLVQRMLPVLASLAGWLLAHTDVALRRHGMDSQVRATVRLLSQPHMTEVARKYVVAAAAAGEPDPQASWRRAHAAMQQSFEDERERQRKLTATLDELVCIWSPRVQQWLECAER